MKIGINALSATPKSTGGGTTYLTEILDHLSKIDHSNNYIIFVRKDSRHHFGGYGDNFRFFSVFMPPMLSVVFRILFEQFLLPLIVLMLRLDILFCPGDSIPFYCPCLSVMNVQNLIYFHFQEFFTLQHLKKRKSHSRIQYQYYKYVSRRSAAKADSIIAVSENAKREAMEYYGVKGLKISVIYHGLGPHFRNYVEDKKITRKVTESYGLKENYILYVGAIVPYKNIETLISALSILKNRYSSKFQLVIAGSDHSGYSMRLESIASKLGVIEQIIFIGHIPYKELPPLYNGARVFAMPSLCESFGLPILEAMACGCPVVCSTASSLPEIAGDAAILVGPKESADMAQAIKSLFEDDNLHHRMKVLGKNRASEFSWDKAAAKTLLVLEQLKKEY